MGLWRCHCVECEVWQLVCFGCLCMVVCVCMCGCGSVHVCVLYMCVCVCESVWVMQYVCGWVCVRTYVCV